LGDGWQQAVELDHLAVALHPEAPEAARTHWAHALTLLTGYTDPRARTFRAGVERHLA
jgi:hypothetical protein